MDLYLSYHIGAGKNYVGNAPHNVLCKRTSFFYVENVYAIIDGEAQRVVVVVLYML